MNIPIGCEAIRPGASSRTGDEPSEIVSPWSCFHCRRRKARCNRRKPCALCAKSGVDCSYPVSGRMPTRQHYPSPAHTLTPGEKRAELINRLRYLEDVVDKLSSQVRLEAIPSGGSVDTVDWDSSLGASGAENSNGNLVNDFGRLHLHEGGSLYVGNKFWSIFNNEVKSVRQAFEDEDYQQQPQQEVAVSVKDVSHTPLFCRMKGRPPEDISQPLPSQVPYIWQVFVENVDPMIKILHVPTMDKTIRQSKGRFEPPGSGMRALMFAISLAAIASLSDAEVQENFHECKDDMVSYLLQGTEESLASAGVLDTTSITVAQAFLLYLDVAGHHYGVRAMWTMTGILVRSAVSMGLHRDGSRFPNVDHFDSEMRRRLWWHICFVDNRVSQCDVPEMALSESIFDTRQPANVNDSDIFPGMTHEPVGREGFTESSYMLAHCGIWREARRLYNSIADLLDPGAEGDKAKDRGLESLARFRSKVLGETLAQPEPPRLLTTTMRLIIEVQLDQLALVIHHRDLLRHPGKSAEPVRHPSFESAFRCLEVMQKWKADPATRQWSWVSTNYHQWHAACVVFAQLRFGPWTAVAEKAWKIAMKFLDDMPDALLNRNPLKPAIFGLVNAAKTHREEEIHKMCLERNPKGSSASQATPSPFSLGSAASVDEGASRDPMTWAWVSSDNESSSYADFLNTSVWGSTLASSSRTPSDAMVDVDRDVLNVKRNAGQPQSGLSTNARHPRGHAVIGEDPELERAGLQSIDQVDFGMDPNFEEEPFNFFQFM
ncbi:unnamed protein product [Clonostachys byssicola]|uniref:Zn(2)-C6 fungal-type domain-containing protein n=1 Tax=Clonostachys byssicola TaxID=160290 RepID=A0A9N9U085_9HYPO|nr:unnamed protein product [Clonostachys byssicola]